MRRLAAVFSLFFAGTFLFAMPLEAEAKRMGGGSSIGRQYTAPKRDTTTTTPQRQDTSAASAPANTTARPSGASRWLGPLAGLAAGGLLAAMLFGDGFQGFQLFDFLVIAALVIGAMMLFRAMRPRPVPQPAGGPSLGGALPDYQPAPAVAGGSSDSGNFNAPAWFNAENFLKGARVHFIRLQAAWDKGDMKDIATYTTPELFAALQAERLASGTTSNYTEVAYLDTQLIQVQRDGDDVVATIRYVGGIKEAPDAEAVEFSELWHVLHDWNSAAGDWFVAGIQQESN